jgi:hypothetical protein
MNDLLTWMGKNLGNRRRMGEELAALLDSIPWFPNTREVRDETVHRGGHTLVFDNPGTGILFQVYSRFFRQKIEPITEPRDNNIIDFRRYGSLLIAELLIFLEKLAEILRSRVPAKHFGIGDSRMVSPGWDVFLDWLSDWDAAKN